VAETQQQQPVVTPSGQIIVPRPHLKISDYPGTVSMIGLLGATIVLLIVAKKFDPHQGALTISLLVVIIFFGVILWSVLFTIPTDEVTSAVIGGLVAAFGSVITYWLTRDGNKH
jgi:uncharacterized membrane protein